MLNGFIAGIIFLVWIGIGLGGLGKVSDFLADKFRDKEKDYWAYCGFREAVEIFYGVFFALTTMALLVISVETIESCGTIGDILVVWGLSILAVILGISVIGLGISLFLFFIDEVVPRILNKASELTPVVVKENWNVLSNSVSKKTKGKGPYLLIGILVFLILGGFSLFGSIQNPLCEQERAAAEEELVETIPDTEGIRAILIEERPELVDDLEILLANQKD